jgi:hypothetical protein
MKQYNLATTDELQSWFIGHFANYLASKGKQCIGWDEILQGGLPDGTTVMSWRGTSGGQAAAKLGHEVVMSPEAWMYLDHGQFAGDDPYEYISGLNSLYKVYWYDPVDGLEDQYKKFVIGAQGNLWSEYVWARDDLEWKAIPRIAAVAEVGWTDNRDWGNFLTRLANVEYKRLGLAGRNAAPIASGLAAEWESNEIPTNWVTMQWPLTGAIGDAGTYQVAFVFQKGQNALRVNNVKLYVTGTLAGSDNHEGVAFDPPVQNIWTIKTTVTGAQKKVYITANVSCDGGSDSNGKIYLYST